MDDAEIEFLQFPVFDLLVQHAQGGGIFCRNHDPAGVPVNPVAESGDKAVFLLGLVFSFLIEIVQDSINQGIRKAAVVLMYDKPRALVYQQKVVVLI